MKVNVGGQKNRSKGPFSDWVIVDIQDGAEVCMDITKSPLPFDNNTVDAFYSSHTLEHIPACSVHKILKELYRCLKPKHLVRLVVPDIDKAIKWYVKKNKLLLDRRNPAKMSFLPDMPLSYLISWFVSYDSDSSGNYVPSFGHMMAYNFSLLSFYLRQAGFINIQRKEYGICNSIFAGCDFKRYASCSVYVEAEK